MTWYAVRTKPRPNSTGQVKRIKGRLGLCGFGGFLPMKRVYRRDKYNSRREVTKPIFGAWVFVFVPEGKTVSDLFQLDVITAIAGTAGEPKPIPQEQMEILFKRHRYTPQARYEGPQVGEAAVIASGPLSGIEGRVIELTDHRARILVELFGGSQRVDVDRLDLASNSGG